MDEIIIEYLSKGFTQDQISIELQDNNIKPNSVSAIEKRLKAIKESYGAKTMFHLAWIIKEKNII